MRFIRTLWLAVIVMLLALSTATAGVIIGGTRIIFDGAKKKHQSVLITLTTRLI
jgi:P pilus assembly chaperone PapD